MSRVSEALQRAKEDREQLIPKTVDGWESWVEKTKDGSPTAGRDVRSPLITLPQFQLETKSWREKFEELLLGWDLRRFKSHPMVALEKDSPAAEQYKILREQVKRIRSETGARFLSVTSPVKRDGKTTVSVNLAVALALDYEEKVLLIDADLRSPDMHRFFGAQHTPGLADYLSSSSQADLTSYIQSTFLPGLQILPAGRPSNLSSELLAKGKMRTLIEEIRSKLPAHEIIVDSPPVLSTPDPLVLASQVEGIIMVIRARKTPRDYLGKALHSLGSSKVIGVVLNGVEHGIDSKYYYRSED